MILLGGGGEHQKDHKRPHGGRGGVHQKITEDHDHKEGGDAKELTKLKVLIKKIITPRISYQWGVQEVISL